MPDEPEELPDLDDPDELFEDLVVPDDLELPLFSMAFDKNFIKPSPVLLSEEVLEFVNLDFLLLLFLLVVELVF